MSGRGCVVLCNGDNGRGRGCGDSRLHLCDGCNVKFTNGSKPVDCLLHGGECAGYGLQETGVCDDYHDFHSLQALEMM
jgi:hypothetical protein